MADRIASQLRIMSHVPTLIEELDQEDQKTITGSSLSSIESGRFLETNSRYVLEQYPKNDQIQALYHWLDSSFIFEEGKSFLWRIICLASKKDDPEKLLEEIEGYLRYMVIGAMKSTATKATPCPTPLALELSVDQISEAAASQTRTPAFDLLLGFRDQFRCQVTKNVSDNCQAKLSGIKKYQRLAEELLQEQDPTTTQAVHIIPFKLATDLEGSTSLSKMYSWQGIYHVFPELRRKVAYDESINDFCNAFTMDYQLRLLFGEFRFGLNPMGDSRYEVRIFTSPNRCTHRALTELKNTQANSDGRIVVTFEYAEGTRDKDKVSDDLLRTHLAIAEIFHLVGGAERGDDDFHWDERAISASLPGNKTTERTFSHILGRGLERLLV